MRARRQRRNRASCCSKRRTAKSDPVPAALLGEMLNRKRIGLVVLSACQSAMVGGEDAMGSVAARLTDSGLPAVLAMTHSVLVQTTRALFDEFYEQLAGGRPVGTSLDNARRALYAHPERGERRRGNGFITLKLQDWFLPALYQPGRDTALLTKGAAAATAPAPVVTGLPELQESGFHGAAARAVGHRTLVRRRHPAAGGARLRRRGKNLPGGGGRPLAHAHRPVPARLLRRLQELSGHRRAGVGSQHPRHGARAKPARCRGGDRGAPGNADAANPRQPGGGAGGRGGGAADGGQGLVGGGRKPACW